MINSKEGKQMRTNVVLDDELIKQAQEVTGIKTKKGVIDEALRLLVRLRAQEKLRELRGKIDWEGDLDAMREGRVFDVDS